MADLQAENAELRSMYATMSARLDEAEQKLVDEMLAHQATKQAKGDEGRHLRAEIKRHERAAAHLTKMLNDAVQRCEKYRKAEVHIAGIPATQVKWLQDQNRRQHNRIRMLMLAQDQQKRVR